MARRQKEKKTKKVNESKRKLNINFKKIKPRNILIIILVIILLFSGYKIIKWISNNKQNKDIKNNIFQYVEINDNEKDNLYKIDLKSLKEINKDAIGYLKVNSTDIDYVVVKTDNNEYYLKHNFEKQENVGGWIFADYKNKFDYTDYYIVVYGHNMKNGSMFGTLKSILKKDWYDNEENKYITLVTGNGTSQYEVFSIYEEKASEYPIQTEFNSDKEYLEFVKTLKSKSIKDFGVDISASDGILTLSTCASSSENRVVLHAVKLKND